MVPTCYKQAAEDAPPSASVEPSTLTSDIRKEKATLRRLMKERRAEAHAENPRASEMLRDMFLQSIILHPHTTIATYRAFGSEMNPEPLTEALRTAGHVMALPVVVGKGQPLHFRRYDPGDRLTTNGFGVEEPSPLAPLVTPDALLVPLLAFDEQRYRLGYGGGFYDRTITLLRATQPVLCLGIAYAAQEIPSVPRSAHDVRLDKIITEIQASGC